MNIIKNLIVDITLAKKLPWTNSILLKQQTFKVVLELHNEFINMKS